MSPFLCLNFGVQEKIYKEKRGQEDSSISRLRLHLYRACMGVCRAARSARMRGDKNYMDGGCVVLFARRAFLGDVTARRM